MSNRVQYRRDTKARWAEVNPVLMEGEVGLEIDTKNIKMGDGTHAWNDLEYGVGIENITSELGDSENLAASQKLITDKFNELDKKIDNCVYALDNFSKDDLNISDESGNILAKLKNGHIKTKNFDSENIERPVEYINIFKGKKISIIGDSTSTFKGYPHSGNDEYPVNSSSWDYPVINDTDMWWHKVADYFSLKIDTINAYGGRRFTYGGDYTSFIDAAKMIGNPDIIIIKGGINEILHTNKNSLGDYNFGGELDDYSFRQALQKTINNVRLTAPNALIFICTPVIYNGGRFTIKPNGMSYNDLVDSIINVCMTYGVECIELHRCGITSENYNNYLGDGIHPNGLGMNVIASYICSKLKKYSIIKL